MKRAAAVAAVAVVVVAGLAVFAFSSGGGHSEITTPTAFDLPALGTSGRVRLAAYRGTPVVVTLFASWCTPCREELPRFAAVARSQRGRVQFIGVDSHETGNGTAFANQFALRAAGFALAADPTGGLFTALGARGVPFTAVYSRSGTIVGRANGALPTPTLLHLLDSADAQ